MIFSTGQTSGATAKLYDVDYNPSPSISDFVIPQNLNNDTQDLRTTISEWQRDLNVNVMPNGTYWGSYFSPSKFANSYKPTWYENRALITPSYMIDPDPGSTWTHKDYYLDYARYSYCLVASHFNWSRQVLMNGASEWWVRLPVAPQSIEATYGITMAIFSGVSNNASDVYLMTDYRSNNTMIRPAIHEMTPQDYIIYQFRGAQSGDPLYSAGLMHQPVSFLVGDGVIGNDYIYLKINSVLKPETDYIIALAWRMPVLLSNDCLYTYWAGDTNLSGRWSHMMYSEFDLTCQSPGVYFQYDMVEVGNKTIDLPLDFGWSFIFTEGIGAGGLFGKKISFQSNATLILYPFFNTSRAGYQHMSFLFPFISTQNLTVEPEIHQAIGSPQGYGPAFPHHVWGFGGAAIYEFDTNIWYNYTDFILFSSSLNLTFGTGGYHFTNDDRWNVRVDLNFLGEPPNLNVTRNYTLTMLCYERDRAPVPWSLINESNAWNTSYYPWARPRLLTNTTAQSFYYDIFCSARGTQGQWAMMLGTVSGHPVYTYHFPQIIWVNPMEWNLTKEGSSALIRVSQQDGYFSKMQDWWGEHYFGEMLKFKFYDKAAAYGGGEGTIGDGLSELISMFAQFGKWLYIIAVSFVGQLVKFLGEALDALTAIVLALVWLVAPAAFMFEVGTAAKMARKITHKRDEFLDELEGTG
jgi:hypothetical protein